MFALLANMKNLSAMGARHERRGAQVAEIEGLLAMVRGPEAAEWMNQFIPQWVVAASDDLCAGCGQAAPSSEPAEPAAAPAATARRGVARKAKGAGTNA